jgi:hypothetical protein
MTKKWVSLGLLVIQEIHAELNALILHLAYVRVVANWHVQQTGLAGTGGLQMPP